MTLKYNTTKNGLAALLLVLLSVALMCIVIYFRITASVDSIAGMSNYCEAKKLSLKVLHDESELEAEYKKIRKEIDNKRTIISKVSGLPMSFISLFLKKKEINSDLVFLFECPGYPGRVSVYFLLNDGTIKDVLIDE